MALERPFTRDVALPAAGDSTQRIQVYFLEAPLSVVGAAINRASFLKPDYQDVNAFHAGLGFSYEGQYNIEFAVDLIIGTFGTNVLLPTIVDNKIIWNNGSVITYYTSIDRNYWSKSTYACTITGSQISEWQRWVFDTYYPANQMYIFFSVVQQENMNKNIIKRTVCDTFAEDSIMHLASLGALIDFVTPIHTSFTPIGVQNPATDIVKLDASDPAVYQRILKFYQYMIGIMQDMEKQIPTTGAPDQHADRDIFSFAKLFATAVSKLSSFIYYSYDENNAPCYYELMKPKVFLNYVVSLINRNVIAYSITGTPYKDDYSPVANNPGVPGFIKDKDKNNSTISGSSTITIIIVLVLVAVLIAFLIRLKFYS